MRPNIETTHVVTGVSCPAEYPATGVRGAPISDHARFCLHWLDNCTF